MPKSHRPRPLYQRGNFRLDRRPDRANLVITRYDPDRKRERISSAGTSDVEIAKRALDALYLTETAGETICPTCGQSLKGAGSALITSVIADYLVAHGERQHSGEAIRHRLAHIVEYVATLRAVPRTDEVDEAWVDRFRVWFRKKPIVSPTGRKRQRAESTIENSVMQLAAAINWSRGKGMVLQGARFRPIKTQTLSQPPKLRADIDLLIRMFRYATQPNATGEHAAAISLRRLNLTRFLRASVASIARPDAVHDISIAPERDQWHSDLKVLNLNPRGRRQTKKRRSTVPIARQVAAELDMLAESYQPKDPSTGFYIPVNSVKSAFETMAADLNLPGMGESGMKLIRRSMSDIVRDRLGEDEAGLAQLEVWLGHRVINSTTELYAPFRPRYLKRVAEIVQQVCDEIEIAVPTAFYRTVTAPSLKIVKGAA